MLAIIIIRTVAIRVDRFTLLPINFNLTFVTIIVLSSNSTADPNDFAI